MQVQSPVARFEIFFECFSNDFLMWYVKVKILQDSSNFFDIISYLHKV